MTNHELDGLVAVVCGGSTGIGRASALRLAAGGAKVAVVARRSGPVDETVAAIRDAGGTAIGIEADVSVEADVERVMRAAAEESDEDLWHEVMNVNVKSMYLTAKHAIPEMRKRGGGAIVNVGSVQGLATQTRVAAYSTSKAANISLTRTIAVDYAPEGIRANIVLPASIDTPLLRDAADLFKGDSTADALVDDWGRMHPIGRVGRAEEVAEMVAFLAGPRASFITGAEFKVDGGMMAALGVVLPES